MGDVEDATLVLMVLPTLVLMVLPTLVLMVLPTLISEFDVMMLSYPVHCLLEQHPLCCDRTFFPTVTHVCLKRKARENPSQHLVRGFQLGGSSA